MGPFESGFMDDSGGGAELAIAASEKTAPNKFESVSCKAATQDYMKMAKRSGVTCKAPLIKHADHGIM
jgi:hypothetical protein